MKKILAVILAAAMIFSLAACGNSSSGSSDSGSASKEAETETEEKEESEAEEPEETEPDETAESGSQDLGDYYFIFASTEPGDSEISKATQAYFDQITAATDGHVTFDSFYEGTLFSGKDMDDAITNRLIDIGLIGSLYYPEVLSLSNVITLAGQGFDDTVKDTQLLWDLYNEYPETAAQWNDGYKVLQLFAYTPAMVSYMLQGGRTVGDIEYVRDSSIHAPVDAYAICMNWDRWNALPEEYREAIESLSGYEASMTTAEATKSTFPTDPKAILVDGKPTIAPTEEDLPGWQEFCDEKAGQWAEKTTSSTGVDAAALLKHAKELYAGY